MGFVQRVRQATDQHTGFCVGLDPTPDILRQWGVGDDIGGLRRFADIMAEACRGTVAMIKPQAAYYERFGPEGMQVMRALSLSLQDRGAVVVYDVKRGDIGSTSAAYGQAYLGRNSSFRGDAMTLTAYLGFGAIQPILEHAAEQSCGVFIVVRSSNPEATMLQEAVCADGDSVAMNLARQIESFNQAHQDDGLGPVGAVVGATQKGVVPLIQAMPSALLLTPGIGFQGASFADLQREFGPALTRVVAPSSRGILAAGPDPAAIRTAIEAAQQAMRTALAAERPTVTTVATPCEKGRQPK
ncbi:MAG: orotidine-5'-phosphate decarboxylase [Alphaproteobacteria bacterium]|nr:MAG: orotidine-5'-phosphate decarboxylase [Alphaproteobacteria bacterium]